MDHNTVDPNVRIAYILQNGEWVRVNGMDIKKGMVFKLYEPDGVTPVLHYDGGDIVIALADSYMNDNGVITTCCEPFYLT